MPDRDIKLPSDISLPKDTPFERDYERKAMERETSPEGRAGKLDIYSGRPLMNGVPKGAYRDIQKRGARSRQGIVRTYRESDKTRSNAR